MIPSAAIASANSEVLQVINQAIRGEQTSKSRKGIMPRVYSPRERAEIGKLACSVDATEAAKRFTKKFGFSINKSTVRSIKKAYLTKQHEKRLREEDDLTISELPIEKKGRPLLGRKLDKAVQEYVLKLRDCGCPINTSIVIAVAKGLGDVKDQTQGLPSMVVQQH